MKKVMRVFLRSVLCGILPFCLLLGGLSVSAYTGNSSQTLTAGADIRVMSYNTLVDNDEANGGWSWGRALGNRAEKAAAAIAYYQPDVIGLQENNYNWHVALRELLPDYDYVNADVPEQQKLEASASLGKKDWMCTTMMYNTKTLKLIENELIGYSVNYWGCIQRMRYVSMAVFEVKATGERFVFTSTHFDAESDTKGQKMRKTQATELANRLNYYKDTYGCPIISTGDYNSNYSAEPVTIVRETAGMTSHPNNRGGIDYVLYSEGVTAKYFTVVNDSDLSGASDHQPIFADLALDNGFAFTTTTTTTRPTTTTTTRTTTTTTRKPTTTTTAAPTTTATTEAPVATQPTTAAATAPVTTAPVATAAPVTTTGSEAEAPTTTATEVETPTDPAQDAATTPTEPAATESRPVADDDATAAAPVEKGNDTLIYVAVAAGVVAVGAAVALFFLLRKKK